MIQLLSRFYSVDNGQVALDGVPIDTLNLKFLRSQMGLVSQEPVLFSTNIHKNIAYGKPGATREEIIAAAKVGAGTCRQSDSAGSPGKMWACRLTPAGARGVFFVVASQAANAHDFVQSFPEGYDTLVGEMGVQVSQ